MPESETLFIASPSNPKVKELVKLRKRSFRDETRRFLIEGSRETERAVDAKISLESLYTCTELFTNAANSVLEKAKQRGVERIELSKDAFEKASSREGPDGILAIAEQWNTSLDSLELQETPLLVIAESIEKPGNLGSIMRSAEAARADALLVCGTGVDLFNPNVIRNAQGACFSLKAVICSEEAIKMFARKHAIKLIATTPDASKPYWTATLSKPVAILMGTEHTGLSDFWLQHADERVAIPMAGSMDSLNVATATAIVLFEAVRQRSG